ncbi:MAG TPA: hypothetical protein VKT72_06515 [Candidatus Baltobacteraceae bacterium]|nr:hypothetical protein [Candidatus Baltobacteraceae bacterium]
MNAKTTARPQNCTCPTCRHTARRTADALFAALTFEMAQTALQSSRTLVAGPSMFPSITYN